MLAQFLVSFAQQTGTLLDPGLALGEFLDPAFEFSGRSGVLLARLGLGDQRLALRGEGLRVGFQGVAAMAEFVLLRVKRGLLAAQGLGLGLQPLPGLLGLGLDAQPLFFELRLGLLPLGENLALQAGKTALDVALNFIQPRAAAAIGLFFAGDDGVLAIG